MSDALALAPPMLIVVDAGLASAAPPIPAPSEEEAETGFDWTRDTPQTQGNQVVERRYPSISELTRPRRNPKSALRTLLEVIGGGLAGCLFAYYILAFWFGPRFHEIGLPQLPLPFISHLTAPTIPSNPNSTENEKHPTGAPIKYGNPPESALAGGDKTAYSSGRSFRTQTFLPINNSEHQDGPSAGWPIDVYRAFCVSPSPDHHS